MRRLCRHVISATVTCGSPATTELTVGPRPFTYLDVCDEHTSSVPDVETAHPIPAGLR